MKTANVDEKTVRAWCPGLPGCNVYAQSESQAKEKLTEAIYGYLASLDTALPDKPEQLKFSS